MDLCLSAPPRAASQTCRSGFLGTSELRGRQSCTLSLSERSQRVSLRCVRADGEAGKAADAKPSSNTSPFAGKKISTLLAARRAQEAAAGEQAPTPSAPAGTESPAVGTSALNPTIASLLKETSSPASTPPPAPAANPVSPFASSASASTSPSATRASSVNAVPASAARPVVSFGKKNVLDALKSDNSLDAMKTAFQPGAPANIFKDEIRSKEQIEAEKFRLEINAGQILLVLSFFASSILMMGTAYIVWKLGAIHYNEF